MLKNKHSRGMVVLGAFFERTLLTETLYALQTDNWTVEGAQRAAIYGALGSGLDVAGTMAIRGNPSMLADIYPSGPQGYMPQASTNDLLASAAMIRAGQGLMNTGSGIISGSLSSITTWVVNRFINIGE